ncbi:viroplasmin family protein [Vibrio parahaemolyticus]|uniref:ribonuclease H family protein n=1 Tax=Vibrio parahaemolyticus TaxID=670 RepID=UPI0004057FAA|nr:ribonuclease H family protein [Vibrio parahaemolyticus]EGR3265122.1 ribonuclease HI [Vibrio parahaemolyticus]EGX6076707.1 ribonuclease HI [Vibrio parahaemolyticus]EKG9565956.1 viroplasmin family protein [Vibrio parahaemolyticus]EKG9665961.1 viroplasmin family protein [Vibrio parahaemolyticus]EKG9671107.1 viroplasmin family protein [Vibrio parahaemolyticus]
MAKKYYVVWKGREAGIFTTWAKCKSLVDGFAGARFKSFPTLEEAESAFGEKPKSTAPKVKAKIVKKSSKLKSVPLSQEQIDAMPFEVKIYTDGACEPNPGEAGTGLAVYESNELTELWYGLYQSFGTNNTAELHGLNQALLLAKEKLATGSSVGIFCDSKYSIDCITKWASGWEKKGWTKSGGEIKNLDIIKPAYAIYQEISSQITIHHVNGHVGIEGNELADRMSIIAIESQDKSLSLYRETHNISELLALRAG